MSSTIWTEKYRPQTFDDVQGQKKIIEKVRAFVKQKNLPHVIFAGPPGVGKSTLALVAAKELFGEHWKHNFLELNSSDDRGIDVVRETIKEFAKTRAIGNAPFKIIFLDESDSLTKEAQQALRRTMETYALTTRFIFSANYSSKIIDPIQSRCTVFRFKPLTEEEIKSYVEKIAREEGLSLSEGSIRSLLDVSEGDVRRITNILQSCAAVQKELTEEIIYSLVSAAKPKEIKAILALAVIGEFIKARTLLLDTMLKHGLSGLDILKQIQKETVELEGIPDVRRMELIEKCGEIEFRMVEGADEFVQLEALLAWYAR